MYFYRLYLITYKGKNLLYFANCLITLVIKILANLLLKCGNQNGQNQKIQVEECKTIGYQINELRLCILDQHILTLIMFKIRI